MSLRAAVLPLVALGASGCHGCRGDHPYVPYSVDSEAQGAGGADAAAAASVESPPALDGGPRFAPQASVAAPPGTSRWPLEGVVLDAPEGRVFAAAAVRDFDGDGAMDAFAIVRPPEGNDPGQLAYFSGQPGAAPGAAAPGAPPPELRAPTLFAPASGLFREAACAPVDRLLVVSKRSVFVELGASCPQHASSAPSRWFAVVAGGAGVAARVRLAATIADPPGAPSLTVDADSVDHDGDGLEDVALRVTIEGGGAPLEPGPRVSGALAWLDRAAGLSRDLGATESSFASLASAAAARAARVKDAPAVPPFVAQVRALYRTMCAEGGSPRLVGVVGTGAIACGAGKALEQAGLAEVRAYATEGDALRAALALDRAGKPPATRTAARETEAQGWITQIAPAANARAVRAVAAVPMVPRGHEPAWGALAFDAAGKLLVRTRAGVVRVDPETGDEASADGIADWRVAVASPDGAMRWIETYDPCDGMPLHASFASAQGDDLRDLALPVPPPLGDRCAGSRGAPARALPLAWGPSGLEAIVEGEPLLVSPGLDRAGPLAVLLDQPFTPGAPRSPDGTAIVVPTGAGLVVKHGAHGRLFRAPELEGTYADQRDCAVSNDASRVACARVGRAWVGLWEAF